MSGPADGTWSAAWEDDLAPAGHDDVGALLARGFGRSAAPFGPGRSAVPFGLLTCGDHVAGFYARAGWVRVPGPTRMVRADGTVQVHGAATMVLPVRAPVGRWRPGRVERNGLEV